MIRQFMNNHHVTLIGAGFFTIFLMTILIHVNVASASDGTISNPSLVDILEAKGVLSPREARQAKKAENTSHKKLWFGGRVFVDYAFYANDTGLDLGDGARMRKARLFAQGAFGDWHFKGQYDFAGNKTKAKDVYIKYGGFRHIILTAGQFKEPFSLEELTSTRFTTFEERALAPKTFVPGRHIGVGINGYGDFWSAAAGVFGETMSGLPKGVDSNFDVTGRVTVAPFHEKGRVLHLGGDISYRRPNSTRIVHFSQQPESHVTPFRLADTGNIHNVDHFISYDLESAVVYGPVSVQGEYTRTNVNFRSDLPNAPSFSGFYVYTSWFVTGESRPYSLRKGAFGRVHPNHNFGSNGWGALELAARFSQLDLEDTGVAGGKEQNVTVGVNWYPRSHVRFMFNWIHASVDRSPLRATHPLMALNNFNPDIFQVRAQVDF